ncbi:MAG: response regulator [Leptospiraceae bacterium]|nr:response regulator [Leptospiraceae bacterium]
MKLLIVDDSTIMRIAIQKILSDKEIEIVGQANNGRDAIELFKSTNPDFVTMDITMPEMDGLTCLEAILKLKPEVKVLVVTALNSEAILLQALKKGAKGFLNKPFTPDKLRDAFTKMVST